MIEIKNTVTGIKNSFHGIISRLRRKKISELEEMFIETSKSEMQ